MGHSTDAVGPGAVRTAPTTALARHWRLVLAITLVALAASLVASATREPSYSATARLVVTPLAQWDETFLGTSLVRDSGDPNRTALTTAEVVDSPEVARETAATLGRRTTARSVREAVDVQPVADTNVLAVTARARDPARASRLADTFASTVLRLRWRRIQRELDDRIALTSGLVAGAPDGDESAQALRTLQVIRSAGRDPTMSRRAGTPAVKTDELPTAVIVALALAGGVFVGGLVAVAIERVSAPPGAPAPADSD